MAEGKLDSSGNLGGWPVANQTATPIWHYMTNYGYRTIFDGDIRPPQEGKDDSSTAIISDHFVKNFGQNAHLQEGYTTAYFDGHVKFVYEKSQTLATTFIRAHEYNRQDTAWLNYFDE